MEKRKRDAFTLVELIIVIMIIGVLAGLLYLVVRPSGDMASEKVCSSNSFDPQLNKPTPLPSESRRSGLW